MTPLVDQSKDTTAQPYQMARKDGNGAALCKEDTVTEDKEMESDRAQTEEEDVEPRTPRPSCKLTGQTVEETVF